MDYYSTENLPPILKSQVILHKCVVSVQEGIVKGRKPRKVVHGDLRLSSDGRLAITGVLMDNDKTPMMYRTLWENIHIFPQSLAHNSIENYGEFCCLYLSDSGRFSLKFFEILKEFDPDLANKLIQKWRVIKN